MAEPSVPTLAEHTEPLRRLVDEALAARIPSAVGCPADLAAAIRHSLLSPGKRLRPMLVLMASRACGGTDQAALPAACAVEMVHAYSLAHDDLPAMDNDDLRRGRPTCHKKFGEAMAILAGDALLAMAFGVLAAEVRPRQTAADCCRVLAAAAGASQLVGGQADDMLGRMTAGPIEALESIHRRKTGAIISVSLTLGAMTAAASEEQLQPLETYGRALGLAFQITDDLLDACGHDDAMGKRPRKDQDRGKATFPGLIGIEASRRRAEALIGQALAAIEPLGSRGNELEALARYVLERNR